MSGKNPVISDKIEHYITDVITRETPLQRRLRKDTSLLPRHGMQTTADQGAFLAMLVRMLHARRIIEIGTFTGYSALAMAQALPPGGLLVACDISREWTDIAKGYWKEAGVDNRIDLRLAPAQQTIAALLDSDAAGTFDMAFIDADKTGYEAYYESCLLLLRTGGMIVFDNMLWNGSVADEAMDDPDTNALRALNLKLRDDSRVDICLLTVADGVMLARKR